MAYGRSKNKLIRFNPKTMLFDFHAHFTFKPFNSRSIYNESKDLPDTELWKERFRPNKSIAKLPQKLEKEVNYTSQIHLNALAESDMRGMCVSLYPLERVFTVAMKNSETVFRRYFDKLDDILFFVDLEKKAVSFFYKAVGTLTGYDPDVIKRVHKGPYNYYEQTLGEYDYLKDNQNKAPTYGKLKYEIAKDYTEYKRIISEQKLAVIISVEGTNCFLDDSIHFDKHLKNERNGDTDEILDILMNNVKDFKEKVHPFFVTLAHHQYNFITGHSPSFIGIANVLFKQNGKTINSQGGKVDFYDVGIRPNGMKVIELLLDRSADRRVLIDTKHMSAEARVAYHELVKKRRAQGDPIPIIQSHTGVNGRPSMRNLSHAKSDEKKPLELSKRENNKRHFSTGSINLFDDEILEIVESDGLMGIMIDEKRIVGETLAKDTAYYAGNLTALDPNRTKPIQKLADYKVKFKRAQYDLVKNKKQLEILKLKGNHDQDKIKKYEKEIKECEKEVDGYITLLEAVFHSILMNQFLHIVKVVDDASTIQPALANGKGWDHICIGTDYEGVINPLDIYYYASDLSKLKQRLSFYWINAINNPKPAFDKYRKYLFDKSPDYWLEKILWSNSERFLEKYFTASYLKGNQ